MRPLSFALKQNLMRLCVLLSAMQLLTACGLEVDPRTLWYNHEGAQQMAAGSASEAQKSFLEALGVNPFISEIHTNLGLTYHVLKQGDQALQSYESAENWARNNQALFVSRFNQGVLRGEAKKVEEALAAYQRALQARPDSMEAKTNIELLIQSQSQQGGNGEKKDQDQKGGQGDQQKKDDQKSDKDKDKDKKDQDQKDQNKEKKYDQSQQYKPRDFEGDLSEQDVKKILGELKQQEQKIRGQFYRDELKEKPRDKDW